MTNLTIRIEEKLKKDAQKTLKKQGLDMTTAIRMFLHQVNFEKGLPFLPTRNEARLKKRWDAQVKDALKNGKSYSNAKELFDDIL